MKTLTPGGNEWPIFNDLLAFAPGPPEDLSVKAQALSNPQAGEVGVTVADVAYRGNYVQIMLSVDLEPDDYRLSLYQSVPEDPDDPDGPKVLVLLYNELAKVLP